VLFERRKAERDGVANAQLLGRALARDAIAGPDYAEERMRTVDR